MHEEEAAALNRVGTGTDPLPLIIRTRTAATLYAAVEHPAPAAFCFYFTHASHSAPGIVFRLCM